MSASKSFSIEKFALHCAMVFAVFMLIDWLYYGLIAPVNPYGQDLFNKCIWTIMLSVPFTYVFYRFNAGWWNPIAKGETVVEKHSEPEASGKKAKGKNKLAQGFLFGLVIGMAFIAIIALSCYVVMYTFIHLLEGFRGVPESTLDDAIIIIKSGAAGSALAYTGKEESDTDRLRPPSAG